MAYKEDKDLEFLKDCSNDELEVLIEYLIKNKDGKKRIQQSLTTKPLYKKYYPNHQKYWRNIVEELQLYGANSIASVFRGNQGVLYREILTDVAKKVKCDFIEGDEINVIEKALILQMLSNSIDGMSEEELEGLVDQLNLDTSNMAKETIKSALKSGWNIGSNAFILIAAGLVAKAVGVRFGLSVVALAGAGTIGASSAVLSALLGPIGVATLVGTSVTGPAYRVTMPCIIQISYMRMATQTV